MGKFQERRRRHFVDNEVQGALLWQAVGYWLWGTIAFAVIVFVYRVVPLWVTGSRVDLGMLWYQLSPLLIASVTLLPLVLVSATRFSNRFVGPILRLRRTLKQLAEGERATPLMFREGDFWKDIASDVNLIVARWDRFATQTCAAGVAVSAEPGKSPEAQPKTSANGHEGQVALTRR